MNLDSKNVNGESPATEEALFNDLVRKFTADALRYAPASFLPALFGIVGVSIFTRLFAPVDYGRYALVVATTAIITVILSGWIQQSVLRYLPRFIGERRLDEFVMMLFVTLTTLLLGVLFLALLLFPAVDDALGPYAVFYIPAVLLIVTEALFFGLNSIFQANLQSTVYSVCKVSNAFLRLTVALLFVLFIRRDVVGLIIGAVAANVLIVLPMIGVLNIWRRLGTFFKFMDARFLRMFALYGLPLIGWMLGGQLLGISDRFVIGAFRGSAEVGIYSANYNLVNVALGLVSTPILIAAHPIIMTAWERDGRARVQEIIGAFARYYLLAVLPVATYLSVFARDIVGLTLGGDFHEGYTITPFVVVGASVWGLSMFAHKGLEVMEKTRVMLVLVAVCVSLNILLNLVFVPRYGYQAAAVTTLVSFLAYPLLVYRASRDALPWAVPWRTLATVTVASVITGVVLAILRGFLRVPAGVVLAAGAVAGPIVYISILTLLREFKPYERAWLWRGR